MKLGAKNIFDLIVRPLLWGEVGASMPAILVSSGILGILGFGVIKSLGEAGKFQNENAVRASATKFQDVMRAELAKTARKFIADDCTGSRFGGVSNPLKFAFDKLDINSLDSGDSVSMRYTTTPVARASEHKDAAKRCTQPRNGIANGARIGAGEYAYFCLKFEASQNYVQKGNLSAQSFWRVPDAFMEVMIVPVQLQTDTPILCRDVNGGAQGAKILYSVYYSSQFGASSGGSLGKRLYGVFYVSGDQ